MKLETNHAKRQQRKKQTAEDFTPAWLVNQMLDKLLRYGPEMKQQGKTFLDPACGNGNILVEVLALKLRLKHDPLISIQSCYGTDIMQDNIQECRTRLIQLIQSHGYNITTDIITAVLKNIICTPLRHYKNGSLDYNFAFSRTPDKSDVNKWYHRFTPKRIAAK